MANQQPTRPQRARSKRDDKKYAGGGASQNGDGNAATYEQELALYLQERIKSDLNRGAIPLLARSIAKELAHRRLGEAADVSGGPSREEDDVRDDVDDDDVPGEADDEFDDDEDDDVHAEADDEFDDDEDDDVHAEADEDVSDEDAGNEVALEDEMRDLQADLGDEWILRVSIQGDDAWLTAEKDDGTQHVEAPAAHVLANVVALLNERGGRSS